MASAQRNLFQQLLSLPEGFRYEKNFLSFDEEQALTSTFERLPFREFELRGFLGKRRTVSFGWRYDFNVRELQPTETIPTFLLALRKKAAEFGGLSEDGLQHALVTEYRPGAAIGWHKDLPIFGEVVVVSLAGPGRLRFRRRGPAGFERFDREVLARSIYRLGGAARDAWEHSLPPAPELRMSISLRTHRRSRR